MIVWGIIFRMLGLLYKSTFRFNYKPHELIISYIQSLFMNTWKSADKECQRHIGPGAWITPTASTNPRWFWVLVFHSQARIWVLGAALNLGLPRSMSPRGPSGYGGLYPKMLSLSASSVNVGFFVACSDILATCNDSDLMLLPMTCAKLRDVSASSMCWQGSLPPWYEYMDQWGCMGSD